MDGSTNLPLARAEELVTEVLGDELLVYDLNTDKAHCLSATAGRVWQRCDGTTQVGDIAQALGLQTAEVSRAVDELDSCDLLSSPVAARAGLTLTRRDLSFKVAKVGAAAAALPLILSIAAPAAAQTQSQIDHCLAIDVSRGCGRCNDGGVAGGKCCCCNPHNGAAKVCAAGQAHCEAIGGAGSKCTEV